MMMVRYGWRYRPQCEENAKKAGEGERERVFSSDSTARAMLQRWHFEAPSWDYWFISSRVATKAEVLKSDAYSLTRT